MNLEFNETLYYIALIVIGIPLVYFTTKSGFAYQEEKKNVIASIILAPIIILLITSAIFGVNETTTKMGRLFGDFLQFIIYMIIGLISFAVCMFIFIFLVSNNKKEVIESIKNKVLNIGRKNK